MSTTFYERRGGVVKYRIRYNQRVGLWALRCKGEFRAFESTFPAIIEAMDYDRSQQS